ncbi:MAG TPA: efflux RND transporter permease subunit [Blastocatellia bacterium]|nr:efflux RND transporter permease subunit [Blastocatellia bacterium]
MAHGKTDNEIINKTHNTARFFVEVRQISWVLLIGVLLWGVYAYFSMPQRKDPEIAVRQAVAITPWPGASADKVEQLVTKKIEEQMAANAVVTKIESISRTSVSVVYLELDEKSTQSERSKQLDDVAFRLNSISDLPDGAGPINFIRDFGDTAALMLTVASPKATETEITLRAGAIQQAIEKSRAQAPAAERASRFTILVNFPQSLGARIVHPGLEAFADYTREKGVARDIRLVEGAEFIGIDGVSNDDDAKLLAHLQHFVAERMQSSGFHPDTWQPAIIRDPKDTRNRIAAVAGDRYTYRELDSFTDLIAKTLKTLPAVSKVERKGLLDEKVYLVYSQERLASYGVTLSKLPDILKARNITVAGGQIDVQGKNLTIDPSGEFKNEKEIGDVVVTFSQSGAPVYLRDLFDISRAYASPARYLNFYDWKDSQGGWQRTRAITLSVQMRSGETIGEFGKAVNTALAGLSSQLPEDLTMARTSDQPLQVEESVDLFMVSLYEAIILVVLVSLVGFWEWRSALLMALAIPITLAMTFGFMQILKIDLQQISIATLIIALGLLVDDPVVAGDSIKRELGAGHPPIIASWLGPTKLASAIMFATITNIVAYLPFLSLSGDTGAFLYSMPVVIGCSLVASRLASMTFLPLLGYYMIKPKKEIPLSERRTKGFAAWYYRVGTAAINHRWKVLAGSLVFLAMGVFFMSQLKTQFFPKDLSYLSYVDVWLPEDAPLESTNKAAMHTEAVIRDVMNEYAEHHREKGGKPREILRSLTTFVGGGGPRFWFSVSPEQQQLNYAQIIIEVTDKHETGHLVGVLQEALSAKVPEARIDVRQLESGKAVGLPVAIRISGDDAPALRAMAEQVMNIFRAIPQAARPRDDWGDESFSVKLQTDPDRANLTGITNLDVAAASATALSGYSITSLREGDKQIPVVAQLRMEERARLDDINNLYVYSSSGTQRVPLRQVSSVSYQMQTEKLRRRNQFRTITVSCSPVDGVLASEVMAAAKPRLAEFEKTLPPGYRMEIGGEEESQVEGFHDLAVVLGISVAAIFLTLVFQFRSAIKPVIVFAAVPYGAVGALSVLWLMGSPFGFMAFLGIVSLVGVIVSHIIVLFDFIEEKHAEGEPLKEALLDAGIMRLRPVLITVGATVIALFPLALHGGPLWEPMCYAQIGGLTAATFITLLLVPVMYSIFVLDLKLIKWDQREEPSIEESSEMKTAGAAG